jgi:hypothetical protein
MTPLTIDTASEQKCLSTLAKGSNWTGNFNYWTGGTQQGCRGSWTWCGGAAGARAVDDSIQWETGQPDDLGGRQDCIHLKNIKGSGFFITDRNCTNKYILACKVSYFKTKQSLINSQWFLNREIQLLPRKFQQIAQHLCALKM